MKILFISYINRSGSTFLANEFSKYDSILVCPEAEVLFYFFIQKTEQIHQHPAKLHRLITNILTTDPKLKFWNLDPSEFDTKYQYEDNFEVFLDILMKYREKVKPEATTILFKADIVAYYCNHIPEQYYKKHNIKIISIIRDGRASYASQRDTIGARTQKPLNRNPVKVAKLWKRWINFQTQHGNDSRFVIIRYEKLMKNFQYQFNHLLTQLDLNSEQGKSNNKGDLYERIPTNQKPMHHNVLKPPLVENINKWQQILPSAHVAIFEQISRKELILMGYPLENPKSNKLLICFLYNYFRLSDIFQSSGLRKWTSRLAKFFRNYTCIIFSK